MFEAITRLFVLFGYIAVTVNAILMARKCHKVRPRRVRLGLWAVVPAGIFWTLFYGHVSFASDVPGALAQWSRLGHTLTIGAFLIVQYTAGMCRKRRMDTLAEALRRAGVDV